VTELPLPLYITCSPLLFQESSAVGSVPSPGFVKLLEVFIFTIRLAPFPLVQLTIIWVDSTDEKVIFDAWVVGAVTLDEIVIVYVGIVRGPVLFL